MSLSSSSIIHFTKFIDYLKGILESNLTLSFCREAVRINERTVELFVPAVCFCDIPLSSVKNHISSYGNFGIGLTKEWAQKNGLNPVLYVEPYSNLSKCLNLSYDANTSTKGMDFNQWTKEEKSILDIFRYIKNYQGDLYRKGEIKKNYRYSDEREWRYVPDIEIPIPLALPAKHFGLDENLEEKKAEEQKVNKLK